ncbi:MAG: hypothetical protein KBT07_01685 [Clostridiales bacterium]|nr:hypothetical protein [Candidatus Scatonaster coprocaballi]
MKNIKTKLLALGMVATMIVGATGCSFSFSIGGSKYSKASKKFTNAAKEACGAEKANSKQRKAFRQGDIDADGFEDGVYCVFSSSEAEGYELTLQCAEAGDLEGVTLFYKIEDNHGIMAAVFDLENKDLAQDYYDGYLEECQDNLFSEERMEQLDAAFTDHEWAVDDDAEDEYLAIQRSDEGNGCDIVYLKVSGTLVYYVFYTGSCGSDVYDEFLDFMDEADFPNPEGLL